MLAELGRLTALTEARLSTTTRGALASDNEVGVACLRVVSPRQTAPPPLREGRLVTV